MKSFGFEKSPKLPDNEAYRSMVRQSLDVESDTNWPNSGPKRRKMAITASAIALASLALVTINGLIKGESPFRTPGLSWDIFIPNSEEPKELSDFTQASERRRVYEVMNIPTNPTDIRYFGRPGITVALKAQNTLAMFDYSGSDPVRGDGSGTGIDYVPSTVEAGDRCGIYASGWFLPLDSDQSSPGEVIYVHDNREKTDESGIFIDDGTFVHEVSAPHCPNGTILDIPEALKK